LLAGCSSSTTVTETARALSPDGKWVAVVDYMSGWTVSSYRVRILLNPSLALRLGDGSDVILCPWGSVHAPAIEWAGPSELRVKGYGSASIPDLLAAWQGVRVTYDVSNQ
jgi:hypothetical protein